MESGDFVLLACCGWLMLRQETVCRCRTVSRAHGTAGHVTLSWEAGRVRAGRIGWYSCGGPFMCIMPSDGGPCRPEGPRGPRAVQTADPWRNVNIMLALLISPGRPVTTGGPDSTPPPPSSPRPSVTTHFLTTSSFFLLLCFFLSSQRSTWLTTCCRWRWGRDTAWTRRSATPGYRSELLAANQHSASLKVH